MPVSGDFLKISSRVSSEGALPLPPPEALSTELLQRQMLHPQSPFIQLSTSLVDEPSYRFPKQDLYGNRYLSLEPFLHILQGPQQEVLPPGSLHRAPRERERVSPPLEPLSTIS
jgi:hypothetical protein